MKDCGALLQRNSRHCCYYAWLLLMQAAVLHLHFFFYWARARPAMFSLYFRFFVISIACA